METYDDPAWVHELLGILFRRKKVFVESLAGARYDILELGGGSASSTVISPRIFDEFVAPYDSQLIELAHRAGQRIAYHTCGGMMPILENIAAMNPNAMETLDSAGHGRRHEPGRGPAADPAEHLHDRRLRSVPFLPGLHGGADAGRGPPLLPRGGPQRRVHPLSVRQFLRGRAGTDQGICRRGEEMRLSSVRSSATTSRLVTEPIAVAVAT